MTLAYDTHIQYLKGVGPKLGDVLRKRGVATVGALLEWFPRAYEDRRHARNIASLAHEQIVSIEATVISVRAISMGKSHRKIYEIVVRDESGRISCKYFRVPYRGYFERFTTHQKVRIAGKVTLYRNKLEFHHPDIQLVSDDEPKTEDQLIPLYTDTEGLSPHKIRKLMTVAIDELVLKQKAVPEVFPLQLREKFNLLPRAEALRLIHCPPPLSGEDFLNYRSPAQRRIIFEEFFWLEIYMAREKLGLKREPAPALLGGRELADKLIASLSFQLTKAQIFVFEEIFADIQKPNPMHRLVQGDVGSGKTVVALLAACVTKASGFQTALMVPTEILAEQHFANAEKLLSPLGIRVALLVGSLKAKAHQEICEKLASGEIDLVIGTHALIEEEVVFKNLGLVVIDEQHRFGVEQRQKLKKNLTPHFLVMTATPIPRTLAMTVYGDLDVSTIDELPPGRSPIVTRKTFSSKREKVFQFMHEQIQKGRQAYVIYPLVEESEKIDLKDAISEYESLKNSFTDLKIGLLHGKMKSDEKDAIMNEFRQNKIQVLVSTTVVEVGVDVPNANMMIIEHAERFGLSQLHQLRGRVGRGEHKSYCVLILGYAVSEEAIHRASVIESTTDGFKIAEADLEIRGPGEFLGRRQSGLPGFKMANLVRDLAILKDARQAATEILIIDPELARAEHQLMRSALNEHKKSIVG
ncbi:MAG: ATP-dependent DNA helicase RecG [Bdellovibrionales bacterium RBG_16_40_8]|nr:MAG: ATP-dependent DNA helicase RecG [Bdellovibrionales bacterium RBG_16_40_8]